MIWLLISMSAGGYNTGTVTAIEFNNQKACIYARDEMKRNDMKNPSTICVPKGEPK